MGEIAGQVIFHRGNDAGCENSLCSNRLSGISKSRMTGMNEIKSKDFYISMHEYINKRTIINQFLKFSIAVTPRDAHTAAVAKNTTRAASRQDEVQH